MSATLPPAVERFSHLLTGSDEEIAAIASRDIDALSEINTALADAIKGAHRVRLASLHVCEQCGGSGYRPEYRYIARGVCFHCGGSGR